MRTKLCTTRAGTTALALAIALVWTTASPAATVNLWDGLISNWAFDEGAGTLVDDGTGSNDATLTATGVDWITSTSLVTPKLGNAAIQCTPTWGTDKDLAPNTGGGATLPTPMDPNTRSLTVAAWVNLDMLPTEMPYAPLDPVPANGWGGILDSKDDCYVLYTQGGTGEVRFKVITNAWNQIVAVPSTLVDVGNWHHVAGVYDGQTVKVYWDGQLRTTAYTLATSPIKAGQVGGFGYAPTMTNSFFPGSIDDAALWGRGLDAQEIAYLYNGGTGTAVKAANQQFTVADPPAMPTPKVYLGFEDNLNNAGTGGPASATLVDPGDGAMTYVTGKVGKAMDLTQVAGTTKPPSPELANSTYARLDYTMTDQGTISFWAKPKSFYDWNEIFDSNNTGTTPSEDWEMWVYGDGRARFRIESNAYVTKTLSAADEWHHFAMTWLKDTATTVALGMYVDGEGVSIDSAGTWIDSGTALGLGGGLTNPAGNVVLDEFRIYDQILTYDQIQSLFTPSRLPGDANNSGVVDAADAAILAGNWLKSVAGGDDAGDFNKDGVVNDLDASILAAHWQYSATSAAVPEPGTLALLAGLALVILWTRRRS